MDFKKEDENYVYNVIGKNVKKYRKLRKLTQVELAEKIDYSLSFVSSLESKKYQTFSLGALWRIALVLDIDMYKLCIDEDSANKSKPQFITFKCEKCDYETDIPFEMIQLLSDAGKMSDGFDLSKTNFNCKKCDGKMRSENLNI